MKYNVSETLAEGSHTQFLLQPSPRLVYMQQAVNTFTPDESEEQRIIQERIRKYLGNSSNSTDAQQNEHLAPDELEEQTVSLTLNYQLCFYN